MKRFRSSSLFCSSSSLLCSSSSSSSSSSSVSSSSSYQVNSETRATLTLLVLPNVILSHICTFLPNSSHHALKLTSSHCCSIAKLHSSTPHDIEIKEIHHGKPVYPRMTRLRIGPFSSSDALLEVMMKLNLSSITWLDESNGNSLTQSMCQVIFPNLRYLRLLSLGLPNLGRSLSLADSDVGLLTNLTSLDIGALPCHTLAQLPHAQLVSLKIESIRISPVKLGDRMEDPFAIVINRFTSLTELELHDFGISSSNLVNLATALPLLRSLRLNLESDEESERPLPQVLFPNLTSVHLTGSLNRTLAEIAAPKLLCLPSIPINELVTESGDLSRFPLLTKLGVHGPYRYLVEFMQIEFMQIQSLQQSCTELHLDISCGSFSNYQELSSFSHLTSLTFTSYNWLQLPSPLSNLQILDLRKCEAKVTGSFAHYPSLTALYTHHKCDIDDLNPSEPLLPVPSGGLLLSSVLSDRPSCLRVLDLTAIFMLTSIHLLNLFSDKKDDVKSPEINKSGSLTTPLPRLQVLRLPKYLVLSKQAEDLILFDRMLVLERNE